MATSPHAAKGLVPSYVVDAASSRFQVRATASGVLSAFGHNPLIAIRKFTGEAWFRSQAPERSSLRIEIDAASLVMASDVNETDRREIERVMKEQVLEVHRFPRIHFAGSGTDAVAIGDGVYRIHVAGNLELHGVESHVEFPCNVIAGDEYLRASGDFSIRQTEYRIKLVSVAVGTLKVKDELKFNFDVVARRRPEAGTE